MSTASTRALLNTFTPLLIANYLIAIHKHTDTTNIALSDVGVKLVQSHYLIHMSVSCQSAVHTYLVPAHQTTILNPYKPSNIMNSTNIVRLLDIATNNSCDYNGLSTEALQSVLQRSDYEHPTTISCTVTTMPYYDGSSNNFQRTIMTWPYQFNNVNREALTTSSYDQNHTFNPGLSPFNVRALSTWIMQFNINCALPSVCESTISSAAISMKSVKLQCQGGQHAHPPYTHEILNASVSFKHVTYATYTNKFRTPNIGTTTTSPVYYYYELHELSSIRLSMIIAFAIMAAACVLRLLIARIQTAEVPRCINCTTNHRNRRHTALRVDFLRHEARQVVHEIPYQAFHRTVPETSAIAAPDVWLHDFMPLPHNVWLHDFTPLSHDDFKKSTAG